MAARRHLVGGAEHIVLYDTRGDGAACVGAREWALLQGADGTRDLDGILAAAARRGRRAGKRQLAEFLAALETAGMVVEGRDPARPPVRAASDPAAGMASEAACRPLRPLEGYRLRCDGSGTCCRLYPTTLLAPVEVARARALCPDMLSGGEDAERAFTPERGPTMRGAACTAMVDGRCAYLDANRLCLLHGAGGPQAKPAGCRLFPRVFVDDGESVRISVLPECACVLASVGRPGGEPLVPAGARTRADLDPAALVSVLPERIGLGAGRAAQRAEYCRWEALLGELLREGAPDIPDRLWSLARAAEEAGLGEREAAAAWRAPAPLAGEVVASWIEALGVRAGRFERRDAKWRAAQDMALHAARWVGAACARLLAQGEPFPPAAAPAAEAFYLRALLHGGRLAFAPALGAALRDRAVRLLVARALPAQIAREPAGPADPALGQPLALVEALLRGHGLEDYAADLSGRVASATFPLPGPASKR
ncbi:MAG: YkgJ family cysteine cluster protein [Deltaproteobacteria bacterium]|nr:YkgJ family cysteine cluster protein [Deltaproteobacteria bacterium]